MISGVGPAEHMYARLRPCDGKLASGIVTVAAAAVRRITFRIHDTTIDPSSLSCTQAPPPPPGDTTKHWYDPRQAPPPPPSIKRASFELFVRKQIRPRVEAICSGGLEGIQHQQICLAVANKLATWQPLFGAGVVAPFCERICWHSCKGEGHIGGVRSVLHSFLPNPSSPTSCLTLVSVPFAKTQADDGFLECPSESCAQESCIEFLIRECPPVQHAELQSLYDKSCSLVPPSPPRPPYSPPPPPCSTPPPPNPPPPAPYFQARTKDGETDSDDNCTLVSYATCRGIVADHARDFGTADVLKVSTAPCEGLGML